MLKKKKSKSALDYNEMLLVIALFALGGWQLNVSWNNPRHVGWIPSGTLLMLGSMVCTWLIWKRRGTQRTSLLPIIIVLNSSILAEHILKWQAGEEGAGWTTVNGILVALTLAVLIAEEITHRKFAAKDATRESKLFDQEDTL